MMPRSYAKLLTTIWQNSDFVALDASAQRLYLLIISQPDLTHCGAIPIRPRRWARLAPDTTIDDIETALAILIAARFVIGDRDTEELLVRSFMRHDGATVNPNLRKAMTTAIHQIESVELQTVAAAELAKAVDKHPPEGGPRGGANGDVLAPPGRGVESTSSSPTPITSSSAAAAPRAT